MRFANPYLLWLLVLLAPMIAYYIYRTLQGGAAIRISTIEGVRRAPRTLRYWLRHFREEKSQEAAPDWLKVCVSDTDPIPSLALPQVSPPAEDPVLPIRLHIHDMMLEITTRTKKKKLTKLMKGVRQARFKG